MLRQYLKESFRLLRLVLLKPLTLAEEADRLSRKERRLILLKVLPVSLALALGILGVSVAVVRHTSDWFVILVITLNIVLFAGLGLGQVFALFLGLGSGSNIALVLALEHSAFRLMHSRHR